MSRHPAHMKEEAKKLALSGKSRNWIAKHLGVSYGTIKEWLVGFDTRGKAKEPFIYVTVRCHKHQWSTLLW